MPSTSLSRVSFKYRWDFIQHPCFPAALPQQTVTISHASGSPTAGQPYSLTCSVEAVPHLVVEHGIVWTRQDGRPIEPSSVNNPQLIFNPLMTSNGSRYTCRAFVIISRTVLYYGSNSTILEVNSKFVIFLSICNQLTKAMVLYVPVTCYTKCRSIL